MTRSKDRRRRSSHRRSSRSLFAGVRRRFHLPDLERDLDDELAFHFERTVEELTAQGLSPSEARAEARRRFGDEGRYRRELERLDRRTTLLRRWKERLAALGWDLGDACRRLGRSPALGLGVVLTLALGLGANATMFGILDRLLLQPPAHVAEPEAVRRLAVERRPREEFERVVSQGMSYPDIRDFQAAGSFSRVAAYTRQNLVLGRGADAAPVSAVLASGEYFPMLGVQPVVGRLFGPADDRAGAPGVAVLGHDFWQRNYDGDPSVVGRTVDFGHGPYEILGVAPPGCTGVDLERIDIWLSLQTAGQDLRGERWREARNWYWIYAVARLAPGVAVEQAEAEATALHLIGRREQIEAEIYDPEAEVEALPLITARGPLASGESWVARWLAGVSLVVLLIACANVANLLLARTLHRRREFGIRLALGIPRPRLLRQVLIESFLLAILGGAAALLTTRWFGQILRTTLLPDVAWTDPSVTARVAWVSLGLCVLAGLLTGILPGLQASRPGLIGALKAGSGTVSRPGTRTRNTLTVLQTALSVVLLVGAGLFVRSLHGVRSIDLGFDPDGLLLVEPVYDGSPPDAQRKELYRLASERLPKVPGVERVTSSMSVPFWSANSVALEIPGVDPIPLLPTGTPILHAVAPDYFATLGLQVRRGRPLTPGDHDGPRRVAVVSETMARLVWPDGDVLGKCLEIAKTPCTEVVGVVEDAGMMSLFESEVMQYYIPLSQSPSGDPPEALLVRVGRAGEGPDPDTVVAAIRRELLTLDPDLRYAEILPLTERIDPQARSWRLGATLFTLFGVLALIVAAVGLYSVLAFAVAQRTQEIGIRSALGADRKNLVGLVLGQALRLVAVGVAIGLGAVWVAAPKLEPLLYRTPARDLWILGSVAAVLLLTALLAGSLPAWRATRLDPTLALRAE